MNVRPGQYLCGDSEHQRGINTVAIGSAVYSTVYGQVSINAQHNTINVIGSAVRKVAQSGDNCLARVVYVTRSHAEMQILLIESNAVKGYLKGVLRTQDQNSEQYSYGDYCLCKILAVSDQAYLLSTRQRDLGVIDA